MKDRLNQEVKDAMRSGDTLKRDVLRMLLSSIHNAEIAQQKKIEESDILGVLAKEAKQRQESIEAFTAGNRPDLANKEEAELAIIKTYLPAQASREEVEAAVKRIIAETGAAGPRDKGKVMPRIIAEFKGKAEGRLINEIVTENLGS